MLRPDEPARVDVLGVHVSVVDLPLAVDHVGAWVREGRREYVCISDVHAVMETQHDDELRRIHNVSGLTVPDGMPLVWAGRYAGMKMSRVRGSDLLSAVCERGATAGWPMYFYGGSERVLGLLVDALRRRYPGLVVVGTESPPYRPLTAQERLETIERINAARPAILWVGLGAPKQERWMSDMRPHLDAAVLLGCGAAFDMNAGVVAQAPVLLRRTGFEWVYRVYQEPRRLWRRYAESIPAFLYGVARRRPRAVAAPQ